MLRGHLTRIVTAAIVAGTIAPLGAAGALAVPSASWSGPSAPIAGTSTNNSPSISSITFPGSLGMGTVIAWRQRGPAGHILYKFRTRTARHWSRAIELRKVTTSAAPVIRAYGDVNDPAGKPAVVMLWVGTVDHRIHYSQGETQQNGAINWTRPAALPKSVTLLGTNDAPAAFFPNNNDVLMVAWRTRPNRVRYSIGTPGTGLGSRGFTWSPSKVIPGRPSVAATSATPAIAEVEQGQTSGTLYIFWKQLGARAIFYSTASDALALHWTPSWAPAPTQVRARGCCSAFTTVAPAASAVTLHGPLLLAYKAPTSIRVRFQTLTTTGWSKVGIVPGTLTAVGPALRDGILAATMPTTIGSIVLNVFH